jgi:hypothetical protein
MDGGAALTALLDDLHAAEILINLRSCHNSFGDLSHSVFLALHLGPGEARDCFSVCEGDNRDTVGVGQNDVAGTYDDATTCDRCTHLSTAVLVAAAWRDSP